MNDSTPRLRTVLARGLHRKCPRCGQGALFQRWITLHRHCPVCGLQYLRNQGDLWGYLLLVDRALFIFPLIVLLYFRLYSPHSLWFYVVAGALVGGLIGTLPQRNGMSVALDYLVRCKWGDLAEPDSALNPPPKS